MSLLFFSYMKIVLFTVKYFCGHCIILKRSLGLSGDGSYYKPQRMCLVCITVPDYPEKSGPN